VTGVDSATNDARQLVTRALSVILCTFTLVQVNYPILAPQPQLAVFALLGLVICFLNVPIHPTLKDHPLARASDILLAVLATICCSWIIVQNERLFEAFWLDGSSLGNRAGFETTADILIGAAGLLLIIEAARRSDSRSRSCPASSSYTRMLGHTCLTGYSRIEAILSNASWRKPSSKRRAPSALP